MIKKKRTIKRILLALLLFLFLAGSAAAYLGYRIIYLPNIILPGDKLSEIVFIPTGSNFEDVTKILTEKKILKNKESFILLAKIKKYHKKIKPGRYRILAGISNNELINLLRAGLQEPVTLSFANIRTKEQLLFRVCKKLEADSSELHALLNNGSYLSEHFGLKSENVLVLFIPNTYKFNWNTSAKQFMERMHAEYKRFWNRARKTKAGALGLSLPQVSVLASIVQAEQLQFPDERPAIAGLFLNRLRIGMALQSDPTLIYALGDFSIQRVLSQDKEIDSPYNTYKYAGLPPGPICIPEISSVDAVLNAEKSNCLYMCAKPDFSGRHNFALTLAEHNRNAEQYRKALNKSRIMR